MKFHDFSPDQTLTLGPVSLSEAEIINFARLRDPQPFHTWAGRDDDARHRPSLATQAERHAGAVRYAVDRFDRRTAIRVARAATDCHGRLCVSTPLS